MPRRRPVQIRGGRQARLVVGEGPFRRQRVSQFPGLSPHGRCVIARLEHTRFAPGRAEYALMLWRGFVRDPDHRLRDPRYGGSECDADMARAREVLEIVAHHLPRRDARRFRRMVGAVDDEW